MICRNCSQENSEDAKFCVSCGSSLTDQNNLNALPIQQAPAQPYQPQQVPIQPMQPQQYGQPQQPQFGQPQPVQPQFGQPEQQPGQPQFNQQQPQQPYGQQQFNAAPQAPVQGYSQQGYAQVEPVKKSKVPLYAGIGAALVIVGILLVVLFSGGNKGSDLRGTYELSSARALGVTMTGDTLYSIFPRGESYIEIIDSSRMRISLMNEVEAYTYTRNGDTISMTNGYLTVEATIDGDDLIVQVDDVTFIFTKVK